MKMVTSGSRNWSRYYSETGSLFIRVGDLMRGNVAVDLSRAQRVTLPEGTEGQRARVRAGDLLISITADIGMVGVVTADLEEAYINQHIALARPSELVNSQYLGWYLTSPEGQEQLLARDRGVVKAGLRLDDIREVLVPLPPANEQNRVAVAIQLLLERGRRATEALSDADDQLGTFDSEVITAAVNGTLTEEWRHRSCEFPEENSPNPRTQEKFDFDRVSGMFVVPDSWQWVRFEDVIDEGPANGYSPKSGTDAQGTRTLKLSATTQGKMILDDATTKRIYERIAPDSRYWLRPGDLLVQRANALEYVGAAAIYNGAADTFIYPDLMMRVRIQDACLREYVHLFLNSEPARMYLRANATGTTGSMPKINARVLRNLPLPLPPVAEIEEILRITAEAIAASARTRSRLDSGRAALGSIQASILEAAFRGKLTRRGQEEESASVLLERVRAELEGGDRSQGVRRMKQGSSMSSGNGHQVRPNAASHVSLTSLLREAGGTSAPEELWRLSELSIDAFYKALRMDVLSGAIRETSDKRILEVKDAD